MSEKKPGSYAGGRKPLAQRSATLDKDRERKALKRAKAAGFETVAEHRASIAAKERALVAERKANPRPATFVQTIIANKPLARRLMLEQAEHAKGYAPMFNRVKKGTDGKPEPVTELPAPGFHESLVFVPPPPPEPIPVVAAERPPQKFNIHSGRWEVIESREELELAAGRRQDVPGGSANSGDPWMRNFDVGFIREMQLRAQRQADMTRDNSKRYF